MCNIMPQLDFFAYSSLVIWFTIAFFFLYFTFLKVGLPNIFKILLFRKSKIVGLQLSIVNLNKQQFLLSFISKQSLNNYFNFLKVVYSAFSSKFLKDSLSTFRYKSEGISEFYSETSLLFFLFLTLKLDTNNNIQDSKSLLKKI